MSATSILTKIPWDKITKYGPTILDMAEQIYDKLKDALSGKPQPSSTLTSVVEISITALADRVTQLEAHELQQAELVSNIARQSIDLSAALQIVSKRVLLLSVLAVFAFLASAVAIAMMLMR